jgi:hypothetical protein
MAKHRYIVEREFIAWKPRHRDDKECRLLMQIGWHLFADLDVAGDIILLDLDANEFEVGRDVFLNSTRPPHAEEIPPSPY